MELRVLNYFLVVAQEESITRAAQKLHLTQPTLSRQMMLLEGELGVTLFERGRRRIALTEAGRLLRERAAIMLALSEKTMTDLACQGEALTGEICLALGNGQGRSTAVLARAMEAFRRSCPQVRFSLLDGGTAAVRTDLERGLADLGLWFGAVDQTRYAFLPMIRPERWGILTEEGAPWADETAVTAEALTSATLLLPREEGPAQALEAWAAKASVRLQPAIRYGREAWAAELVRAGAGIALCPEREDWGAGLQFVPLSPPLEQEAALIWKKDRMLSPAAAQFVQWLRQALSFGTLL